VPERIEAVVRAASRTTSKRSSSTRLTGSS
jgi:hypothetical protein